MSVNWKITSQKLIDGLIHIPRGIAQQIQYGVIGESFKSKHGRIYSDGHQSSAAGEPFATDSWHYVKSIDTVEERTQTRFTIWIGVKDTPYAVRLETTMKRPVWLPQAKRAIKDFRSRSRRRRR